ncbi:MAG: hypothetical protein GXP45_04945 [bacterium]|nr:hypothetical protein [bacterium]
MVFNVQSKLTEKKNEEELEFLLEKHFQKRFNKDIFLRYDEKNAKYFVDIVHSQKPIDT